MKIVASVAVVVHNSEKFISKCLSSILAQTIRNIEIIIVEDPPFDRTEQIVNSFEDERITYFKNQKRLGISGSRNKCLQLVQGKYVFFTDDDCLVQRNWVEEGLKTLRTSNSIAVEGKTIYVSKEYEPTFSNRVIECKNGGHFMTCNIAYKTCIFDKIGGFDENFSRLADRDLALRLLKLGKICFNPSMVVYHQKICWEPMRFVKASKSTRNRVLLFKKSRDKSAMLWRIIYPESLLGLIFPPLIFVSLFRRKYTTRADFALFPFLYLRFFYERLNIWDMCARERVFLI